MKTIKKIIIIIIIIVYPNLNDDTPNILTTSPAVKKMMIHPLHLITKPIKILLELPLHLSK